MCAAPGNKTTHLASLVDANNRETKDASCHVFAFDCSSSRFETLKKMVATAGASSSVKCQLTNFLDVLHSQLLSIEKSELYGWLWAYDMRL